MGGSSANNTRTALWIVAFFLGWPVVAWLAVAVGVLVFMTNSGTAVAVAVEAAVAIGAAWLLGGFAIRRGAPLEVWIPVAIGSLMPVAFSASVGLGDFELYRLLWIDTYWLLCALVAAIAGPALAVWVQWRRSTAAAGGVGSATGTQLATADGQER
ncbi:MAG: hypothetical protein Q7U89_07945 [Coriobacteriia bacterium]|nr:hypothetical protein [Coriobacteriia bacterium]